VATFFNLKQLKKEIKITLNLKLPLIISDFKPSPFDKSQRIVLIPRTNPKVKPIEKAIIKT